MPDDQLRNVYALETQEDTDEYYSKWAESYDEELTREGYRTPERCAAALTRFVGLDAPVLDIGCGTGLSGAALAAAGFTNVSGQDVNAAMLEQARRRGVYRDLRQNDIADPYPFEPGTYAALTAVGVIGIGAGPASLVTESLDALAPGGHLLFSYSDHALDDPTYRDAVHEAVGSGRAEEVMAESGPHIDGLGSSSTIFVLRRR